MGEGSDNMQREGLEIGRSGSRYRRLNAKGETNLPAGRLVGIAAVDKRSFL